MDQTAFDVFFSVKNFLYLGDYGKCLEEISIMDINEDDLSQRLKKSFYTFISYLEGRKYEEINKLLGEIKSQSQSETQLKTYFNLFLFFVVYAYKEQFDENKYSNFINDLKEIKRLATPNNCKFILLIILCDKNKSIIYTTWNKVLLFK